MSDRFYTQMAEHFRMPHYELNIALRDHDSPEYKKARKESGKI
ncbi:hypothetical protein [Salmonella phage GSW6]|uniref:Uncharacterized protein n=1 Tax=Salmonella phage GSW6 TaxID=3025422 RepID=A0AAE9YMM4_9CAUD|nr:hypothetical protein [Salmonella phage GSW6]